MRTNAVQETTTPFPPNPPFMSSGMKSPLTENAEDMARDIPWP